LGGRHKGSIEEESRKREEERRKRGEVFVERGRSFNVAEGSKPVGLSREKDDEVGSRK
jgi:hypothetical protein